MLGADDSQESYRAWALVQAGLPLYWQPKWLDVSEPDWRAASDDWDDPSWIWPYALHRRAGQRWIGMPRATNYLGPKLLKPDAALPALPNVGVRYGIFTLHYPHEVSKYPGQVRAMVGLSLNLELISSPTTSRKRRIRRFAETKALALARSVDTTELLELFRTHAALIPSGTARVMSAACRAGFGEYYVVRADDGNVISSIGVVFDDRVAYQLFLIRGVGATDDTGSALQDFAIRQARERGLLEFDFQSGHLPGPYQFFRSFGAQPQWYGQVRAATSKTWRLLETVRGLTNSGRI